MSNKELTYKIECGPDDILYTFVYDYTPPDPGYWRDKNGDGCPPSEGRAEVYEIRGPDGVKLKDWTEWVLAKIDVEAIEKEIYIWHGERERDAEESAMENKADARREEGS